VFARPSEVAKLPYGLTERDLPPLPDNFDYHLEEPPTMRKHMDGIRDWTTRWSPLQWRYYMWSYYRMVEMVDAEVGRVLDALEDSRFASDTIVILTADHGDGLARRKMVQKWTPYDEAARVPLIVAGPGVERGKVDRDHVVSGLDIPATLCSYAGVASPPGCAGRSLRPLVEGKPVEWREFAVAQANITGRMIRTPEYKLITYKGESPEMLFDMRRDPWEMTNLANQARHADVVSSLKARLEEFERSAG
jgi:arylsulfatase A-like enzyme